MGNAAAIWVRALGVYSRVALWRRKTRKMAVFGVFGRFGHLCGSQV
jgi:hypothetical protein